MVLLLVEPLRGAMQGLGRSAPLIKRLYAPVSGVGLPPALRTAAEREGGCPQPQVVEFQEGEAPPRRGFAHPFFGGPLCKLF